MATTCSMTSAAVPDGVGWSCRPMLFQECSVGVLCHADLNRSIHCSRSLTVSISSAASLGAHHQQTLKAYHVSFVVCHSDSLLCMCLQYDKIEIWKPWVLTTLATTTAFFFGCVVYGIISGTKKGDAALQPCT